MHMEAMEACLCVVCGLDGMIWMSPRIAYELFRYFALSAGEN